MDIEAEDFFLHVLIGVVKSSIPEIRAAFIGAVRAKGISIRKEGFLEWNEDDGFMMGDWVFVGSSKLGEERTN